MSGDQEKFLTKKKILLGIESKQVRNIIVNMCKDRGATEILFGNGAEVIMEAVKFQPNVVFCEYNMSPLNGLSFMQALRPKLKTPTPIIMLVSELAGDEQGKARQAGATEILPIPFSLNDLVRLTKKTFERVAVSSPSGLRFGPRQALDE